MAFPESWFKYMQAITTENISKVYNRGRFHKGIKALDGLSLSIEEGEIFGFLGPNGAGKTTLLKILLNIIYPTTGHAELFGVDVRNPRSRRNVGYLPENPYFYDRMSANQLLEYYGQIYGMSAECLRKRRDEVIEIVGLEKAAKRHLRSFSKGMLQRIGLAQALISEPKLVFLDEPSTGLDPMGRRKIKDVIRNLKTNGTTIFLNSHILADVEDTCDRVGIVKEGRLIRVARVEELTTDLHRVLVNVENPSDEMFSKLSDLISWFKIIEDGQVEMAISTPDRTPDIVKRLVEIGARVYEVRYYKTSLEDMFIKIMEDKGGN
jgi:ABC-2 type transport system ATP-binding protein